jgi:hypothetical protein
MSRYYEMSVEIKNYDPNLVYEIQEAAQTEWSFDDDWYQDKSGKIPVMSCYGQSNLCGGEREEEFGRRLRLAIWKANKKYCDIALTATCLEDLPHEFYSGDEDEYEKAKAEGLLDEEKEDDSE